MSKEKIINKIKDRFYNYGWNSALKEAINIIDFSIECAENKSSWIQDKTPTIALKDTKMRIEGLLK